MQCNVILQKLVKIDHRVGINKFPLKAWNRSERDKVLDIIEQMLNDWKKLPSHIDSTICHFCNVAKAFFFSFQIKTVNRSRPCSNLLRGFGVNPINNNFFIKERKCD